MNVASLQSKLDESQAKVDSFTAQVTSLQVCVYVCVCVIQCNFVHMLHCIMHTQNQLKEQELRNERLSTKLQQRYCMTSTSTCRCTYMYTVIYMHVQKCTCRFKSTCTCS